MDIKKINDRQEKRNISTAVLKSLPNWFGIPESTQEYIDKSIDFPFFVASDNSKTLGFISLKENNQYTAEIFVMGVIPDFHKQGIGKALVNKVVEYAKKNNYEFLQVKTLDETHPDIYYLGTRKFYLSVGFKPLECLPELWGKENPCLIMIRNIN